MPTKAVSHGAEESPPRHNWRSLRSQVVLLLATTMFLASIFLAGHWEQSGSEVQLLGTWEEPHGIGVDKEPWSAPANLWLYWGSTTNRRFSGSGEVVRHIFKMGNIEGGEWRDPRFLRSIHGSLFRGLSQKCCATLLFPPMEWDFPVENPNKAIGQRLRSFVANGNGLVLTGGIMDMEFINRYFFYHLEQGDGNYAPGPFEKLLRFQGLSCHQEAMLKPAPEVLPQKGISVTVVKKESLPQGASVLYDSPKNTPVVLIKFCMADNPLNSDSETLPPVKVLPRDCEAAAAAGRPCSCGNICFLGYDFRDRYPSRWDDALKLVVDACSVVPPDNSNPALYKPAPAPAPCPADGAAEGADLHRLVAPQYWEGGGAGAGEGREEAGAKKGTLQRLRGLPLLDALQRRQHRHHLLRQRLRQQQQQQQHSARRRAAAERGGCGPICQLKGLVSNMKASF